MDLLGGAGIVWALPIMKARKTVLIMHSFSYTSKHQTLSQGLCPKSYAHRALAPRPPSPLGLP
jgi:hypothetical protein